MEKIVEIGLRKAAAMASPSAVKYARQGRWHFGCLRTVSTHMPVAEAEAIEQMCERHGITRYALMRLLLREWMAYMEAREGGRPQPDRVIYPDA